MKFLLSTVALATLVSTQALAAPTISADGYAGSVGLTSASISANGSAPIACTLPTVAGVIVPTCDVVSLLTVPNSYSMVMSVANSTASASSLPFVLTWRGNALAVPTLTQSGNNVLTQSYPTTENQPSSVTISINGAAPVACTTSGLAWSCPLITTPGNHTATVAAVLAYACVSGSGVGTCNGAGLASSIPFSFQVQAAPQAPTGIRVQ